MVERVLIDASGLRVSKPGISVLAAAPSQRIFDSSWAQLGQYSHQDLDIDWTSGLEREFPWGKTFPSVPIVLAWYLRSDGAVIPMVPGANFYLEVGTLQTQGRTASVEARPHALWIRSVYSVGPGHEPPPIRIRYTVMDYNL